MRKFTLSFCIILTFASLNSFAQTTQKSSRKSAVDLRESNLPIVVIDPGEEIKDDGRVPAEWVSSGTRRQRIISLMPVMTTTAKS
ncbi:MAG: hypothetical protein V5A47_01870 [Bacteroidales bacterium]